MTTEMLGTCGNAEPGEFDLLLNDVLRTVANPGLPERLHVNVQTRIWVREMASPRTLRRSTRVAHPAPEESPSVVGHPAVVFSPAAFQARMNPKRDPKSTATAILAHAAAIALIFWMAAKHVQFAAPVETVSLTELTPPPPTPPAKDLAGGGGGRHSPTPVGKGALPKFADRQITPPKAPPMLEPKIKMPDAAIEVQKDLKMATNNMPNLGMPSSPLLGSSMGNGHGTGLGAGDGSGLGQGVGGNYGDGVKHIGGGVSAPQLIFSVEPEFSEEARKAKTSGNVLVNLRVDEHGNPTHIRVLRGVGMGLDEKAIAAVKQYRFKPAMEAGRPVTVELNVEVNFQIF